MDFIVDRDVQARGFEKVHCAGRVPRCHDPGIGHEKDVFCAAVANELADTLNGVVAKD
jgi:hypothetical protein